jgi:hypothetical protein
MGLLEYQTMPSLRHVAHDGGLCAFTILQQLEIPSSVQLGSSCQGNRYSTEKPGGTARRSRTKSHLPAPSPPASQAGRRIGPAL